MRFGISVVLQPLPQHRDDAPGRLDVVGVEALRQVIYPRRLQAHRGIVGLRSPLGQNDQLRTPVMRIGLKHDQPIAANGILVLVPAALFLASKARAAEFDAAFYGVQALELIAGAVNIILLGLNMRDGFKMTGRFRRRPSRRALINRGA